MLNKKKKKIISLIIMTIKIININIIIYKYIYINELIKIIFNHLKKESVRYDFIDYGWNA